MENIIVYPKNEKQKKMLESILSEMKIEFEIERELSKEEYYSKINKSIVQAEDGKTIILTEEGQKEFLGL